MDQTRPAIRKRCRPALSCVECRRRKSKCDRKKPCSQCVQSGCLICRYSPDAPPSVRGHYEDGRAPSTPASSLSQPSCSLSAALLSTGNPNASATEPPLFYNGSGDVPSAEYSLSTVNGLRERVQELERKLREANSRQANESSYGQISMNTIIASHRRGAVSRMSLFGRSRWMHGFTVFDTIAGLESSISDMKSDIYPLITQCRQLLRKLKAEHFTHIPMPLNFGDCVPPRELSDKIVQTYFRTSEPLFRILHFPTFHQEYIQHWHDPNASKITFKIKLLLVLAIGSHFHPNQEEIASMRGSTAKWIYAAQSWLGGPSEDARLNITCLQIHCLLSLARQTNAVGGDLTWISAGSLLRHAMTMGLHRDPSHFPKISIMSAEIRRRLWGTVLEILVQASLDAGMPPLISYDDFDCKPPSNIDDRQIYETMTTPPIARPNDFFTQCIIQLALMDSLPLRLEVAKSINDFRTDPSYENTIHLGTKLTSACHANSILFQSLRRPSTAANQAQPTAFQAEFADMLVRRFLIPLHCSFAVSATSSPTYYFSRKICMETALVLLSKEIIKQPREAPVNEYDDPKLLRLGSGLFKSTFVHCMFAICFELITQLQEQSSTSAMASSLVDTLTRKELHRVLREAIDIATYRIQDSETSAKQHLFLSCVLAQVESMQAGQPLESRILDAARESLEFCAGLFAARVQRMQMQEVNSSNNQGQGGSGLDKDEEGTGCHGLLQETPLDFEMPDSWLFSGWESFDSL